MNFCGYGVLIDGKPKGIWPLPLEHANKARELYRGVTQFRDKPVDVVAIYYASTPVSTVHPKGVFAGGKPA